MKRIILALICLAGLSACSDNIVFPGSSYDEFQKMCLEDPDMKGIRCEDYLP